MKSAILGLLAALLAAGGANAQFAAESDAPIDISGDAAEFQDNIAIWTGNVRVVQEESILAADRIEADVSEDGDFSTITATGAVRYTNGKEAITGRRLIFDNEARTITVMENVIVTQGKQVMSAGAVTFWIDTGMVKFAPADGRRIRGIFYPENEEQT